MPRKKVETTEILENVVETTPAETNEIEPPTPKPEEELIGANMCYCTKCDRFRGIKGFTLDRHGMLMIKLQCSHTEYFAFKVELSGKKAEEQFGK